MGAVGLVVAATSNDGRHAAICGSGQLPILEPFPPLVVGAGKSHVATKHHHVGAEFGHQFIGILPGLLVVPRIAPRNNGKFCIRGACRECPKPKPFAGAFVVFHNKIIYRVGFQLFQPCKTIDRGI